METNNSPPQRPSFGKRFLSGLRKFILFLFRLLIILVVIAAIGTAFYYGAPVLVDEYLMKDVDVNSSRIQEIDNELTTSSEFFSQRLIDLQSRIESLEIQNDTEAQVIDNLQVQVSTAEYIIENHKASIDSISTLETALDEYQSALSTFEDQLTGIEDQLGELGDGISTLNLSFNEQQKDLEILSSQFEAQNTLEILRQDLELLKVMDLVTRVRISIAQENYGSAKENLEFAQEIITTLISVVTPIQSGYLADISQRLALAFENLTISPDLVHEDLEVAWQLLLQGFPGEDISGADAVPGPTTTSDPSEGADETPTITPTSTPEP